jgi:hypothetical protein
VHRAFGIEPYDQTVAQVARLSQIMEVPEMQYIKATIGEYDAESLRTPGSNAAFGLFPICYLCFYRR